MLRCSAFLHDKEQVEATAPSYNPLFVEEFQITSKVNNGSVEIQAVDDQIVAQQNITAAYNYTNTSIAYWEALQLTDPGNGDTLGTLGYFAVSARDFWQQVKGLFDAGANPNAILDQFKLWRDYTAAQAGKSFAEMQPIDKWWEAANG